MPYAPRRRAARRRFSARRRAAVSVFAVLSLACAGYLAWEFVGTTWVAHRHQREALAALTAAWHHRAPRATVGTSAVDGVITIPRLGVAYAVPLVEGTGADSLAIGIGHVAGTAEPGAVGNLVLAGHRVTHGQPFYEFAQLQPGDRIYIDTFAYRFAYALDTPGDGLTLPSSDDWVLRAAPRAPAGVAVRPTTTSTQLLTLVTCAELFHTSQRWVAFGHLISRTPLRRASSYRGGQDSHVAGPIPIPITSQGAL